jgi:hypothetical protein
MDVSKMPSQNGAFMDDAGLSSHAPRQCAHAGKLAMKR